MPLPGNVEVQIRSDEDDCRCDFTCGGKADFDFYDLTKSLKKHLSFL